MLNRGPTVARYTTLHQCIIRIISDDVYCKLTWDWRNMSLFKTLILIFNLPAVREPLFYFCPLAQYYSILCQVFENLWGKNDLTPRYDLKSFYFTSGYK